MKCTFIVMHLNACMNAFVSWNYYSCVSDNIWGAHSQMLCISYHPCVLDYVPWVAQIYHICFTTVLNSIINCFLSKETLAITNMPFTTFAFVIIYYWYVIYCHFLLLSPWIVSSNNFLLSAIIVQLCNTKQAITISSETQVSLLTELLWGLYLD